MSVPPVTPQDLQDALASLAIASSSFTRGRGRQQARENLARELTHTMKLVHAPVCDTSASDPVDLINRYLSAGGNWRDLAAAVNRHAFDGSRRKTS